MTTRHAEALVLIAILERENAALTAMDLSEASACLEAKQGALEALTRSGDAKLADLETMSRLAAAARLNQELLRQALAAQGRVIEIVAGAGGSEP